MKRLSNLFAIAFLIAALAVAGCKKDPEKEVIGTWSLSGNTMMAGASNPMAKASEPAPTSQTATLTIKTDKTFTMQGSSNNAQESAEGTWTVAGDKLNLTLTKVAGVDVKQFKESMQKLASSIADMAKSMANSFPGAKAPTAKESADSEAKMKEAMDKIDQPMVFDLAGDYKSAKPDISTGMFSGSSGPKEGEMTMTKVSS